MQMTPDDARAYPKMRYYVEKNLPDILTVPILVKAMDKVGQIDEARLKEALVRARARP